MTDQEFQAYIDERYQDQVQWYNRKAGDNQRIYTDAHK